MNDGVLLGSVMLVVSVSFRGVIIGCNFFSISVNIHFYIPIFICNFSLSLLGLPSLGCEMFRPCPPEATPAQGGARARV